MTSILPIPESYYTDNNGLPLSFGLIYTYVPGTLVPKACWLDPNQQTLATNPIVLSASGRVVGPYGSGAYRFRVFDQNNNLIYDELTNSTLDESSISQAMLPVTSAGDLITARRLMGIDDEINTALAAINLLTGPTGAAGSPGPSITGPTGSIGPTGPTGATPTGFGNGIVQSGVSTTDINGFLSVTFAVAYSFFPLQISISNPEIASIYLTLSPAGVLNLAGTLNVTTLTTAGFVLRLFDGGGIPIANTDASWVVIGF